MRGNITRRGKSSWRLKFDVGPDPVTGVRVTRLVTVKGKRQDAEKELTRLLAAADTGTLPEPSSSTVADYMRLWLKSAHRLSPKTAERFGQLVEQQIIPHLGTVLLQKLKPLQVEQWHSTILRAGGKNGRPLAPATVKQAHRVLHLALASGVRTETLSRNVAGAVSPPEAQKAEIECLRSEQIGAVLEAVRDSELFPIVSVALATGARRGEILALRWCDVDLEARTVKIARSLEQTKAGLRFKPPKTEYGSRTISLPAGVVEVLKSHRRQQLEARLAIGQGRPSAEGLIFSNLDDSPVSPLHVSTAWSNLVRRRQLPKVSFHGLRHTHASTLIVSGVDLMTVSRRLGHASPVITLGVYGHLVKNTDRTVTDAIEAAMRTTVER